jgi:type III pantothenate kinase
MTPDIVVDVGNARIKWGRCSAEGILATATLPPDDPDSWQGQYAEWGLEGALRWAVTGVHPHRCEHFLDWLRAQGQHAVLLNHPRHLPLRTALPHPEHAGIDRLLDAVAANSRRPAGTPAAIVDAGSAVTVDLVDAEGIFQGGAILPGPGLMARALHEHTALLPPIVIPEVPPPPLGDSTTAAMASGIFHAVAGGIRMLCESFAAPTVFLTGGDAALLRPALGEVVYWPAMTLEGVRLSAEAML